jgi:hypothetical protein
LKRLTAWRLPLLYTSRDLIRDEIIATMMTSFWATTVRDPINLFTFALVLVGAIQAGLFFWQLSLIRDSLKDTQEAADAARDSAKAAKDGVELARETSERELRAYVLPEIARVTQFHPDNVACLVILRNSGKTPASDISIWSSVAIAVYPVEKVADPPVEAPPNHGFLAANANFHVTKTYSAVPAELAGVKAGHAAVYMFGRLTYRDVFNKIWATDFCFFYGGEAGLHPEGIMAAYSHYNRAT